jgi:peptide/nickel transport system permease protein
VHLFGTDDLGRDLLNLTVHGARISLVVGALSAVITLLLGGGIGMIAGYRGGRADALLMRIADTFLILPTFVLALILAPILRELIGDQTEILGIRTTLLTIVAVIGITSWSSTARIVRSQTLSLRERTFVERARLVGLSPMRIIARHIFPNIRTVLVANGIVVIAGSILTESTLSFIGLGDPFQPSWGTILGNAQSAAAPSLGAWWFIMAPGGAILFTVIACTIVGNAIDELLDRDVRVRR